MIRNENTEIYQWVKEAVSNEYPNIEKLLKNKKININFKNAITLLC